MSDSLEELILKNEREQELWQVVNNSSGKRYSHNKQPIRLSRDTFTYKLQFPKLDSVSGLKFLMPIDEYQGEPKKPLEVKIPLNWGD